MVTSKLIQNKLVASTPPTRGICLWTFSRIANDGNFDNDLTLLWKNCPNNYFEFLKILTQIVEIENSWKWKQCTPHKIWVHPDIIKVVLPRKLNYFCCECIRKFHRSWRSSWIRRTPEKSTDHIPESIVFQWSFRPEILLWVFENRKQDGTHMWLKL